MERLIKDKLLQQQKNKQQDATHGVEDQHDKKSTQGRKHRLPKGTFSYVLS